MTPSNEIESLRLKLGLPDAPTVMSGLRIVDAYFREHLHLDPTAADCIKYIRGIDFHHPVNDLTLNQPTELVRYRPVDATEKPFSFFTKVGTSPMRTGTNFPNVTFERYIVQRPILALESVASSISFGRKERLGPADKVVRPGGAIQYIVASLDLDRLTMK